MRLTTWFAAIFLLFHVHAQAETLTLWNAHSLEHLQPELTLFEKITGHKVIQQHFRADQLRDKVLSSVLLPDLYFIPSDQISNVQEYHLGPWPESIARAHGLRDDGRLGNNWYGMPINMGNQLVLFYRKDMVAPVTRLEDIPAGKLAWPSKQAYWFMPFLTASGGWPLKDGTFNLNTPQMVAALTTYREMINRYPVAECELMCNEQAFIKGEVTYLIDGDWAYQTLKDLLGDKLGVALLPSLGGKPMVPLSSSYVMARRGDLSDSKQRASEELVRFLLSDERQKALYQRSKLFPSVGKVAERLADNMSDDMRVLHQQLLKSRAMPNDRSMMIVWLVMGKCLELYLSDEYSAKETAENMQTMALEEGGNNR